MTAREVSDELRGMGLPMENIEVVRALSKLVNEGKATKTMDSDRMIRYLTSRWKPWGGNMPGQRR